MDDLADKEQAAFNQMLIDARWPDLEEGLAEHSLAMDAWLKGRLYERATPDQPHYVDPGLLSDAENVCVSRANPDQSATIKLLRDALKRCAVADFLDWPSMPERSASAIARQALAATKGDVG